MNEKKHIKEPYENGLIKKVELIMGAGVVCLARFMLQHQSINLWNDMKIRKIRK